MKAGRRQGLTIRDMLCLICIKRLEPSTLTLPLVTTSTLPHATIINPFSNYQQKWEDDVCRLYVFTQLLCLQNQVRLVQRMHFLSSLPRLCILLIFQAAQLQQALPMPVYMLCKKKMAQFPCDTFVSNKNKVYQGEFCSKNGSGLI